MRRACFDQAILRIRRQLVGIGLGYDYAAEHEWGIDRLKEAFGIPSAPTREVYGAVARMVTKVPAELRFHRHGQASYLIYSPSFEWRPPRSPVGEHYSRLIGVGTRKLTTAWSEDDFGICVRRDRSGVLHQIHHALTKHDAMIFLNGAQPFGGSGLMIGIRSALPPDVLERMRRSDLDYLALQAAAAATGIAAKLKAAGKRYFALSPKWADDQKSTVVFWLNPMDQQCNNFGWFTIRDLEDWIEDQGKIPIRPQPASV